MVDADMVLCCLHALVLSICCRCNCGDRGIRITLPSGAPGLHTLLNYFGIIFRFDYTYTYTFHCSWNQCQECNRKLFWGPIPGMCKGNMYLSSPAPGAAPLWDYTYTPEMTLTLLNSFRINFQNITLTLTHFIVFELRM